MVQRWRRGALRHVGVLALLALAVPGLAGCDLGSKPSGGGGGGSTAAVIGPSTTFSATPLSDTQVVTSGNTVVFGPATFPLPLGTGGARITLQSSVGASIFVTDPTVQDCTSTSGAFGYNAYAGAFSVTNTETTAIGTANVIGVCFYASLSGVTGARSRITITHDATAPTPLLFANGIDPAGPPQELFSSFPTITMRFSGGTDNGTIYYTTDGTTPTVDTPSKISVVAGVGSGSFVFTHASRTITMLAEDEVGNLSAATPVTLLMELTATSPSAGYYSTAQSVKLVPPSSNYVDGISGVYLLLCQFELVSGYECYDNTLTLVPGAVAETLPVTGGHYAYDFGVVGSTDDETITLPGVSGETVVYDLRFALDPLGSGTLDATQQAYFIIDRDIPSAIIYADPDRTDNDQMRVAASVFDRGAYTVSSSQITNFALKVDKTDPAELCAGSVATVPPCLPVNQATVAVPSTSFLRPQAGSSVGDNKAVTVTVTATDAAANASSLTRYMPIGRTVLGSPADTDLQLGYALAQGNFNCDAACLLTGGSGAPDAKYAPDVVVGEPGNGAGNVYIFYDGVRSEVTFTSPAAPAGVFVTPLNLTTLAETTIPIQVDVDGATLNGTIDLAQQLTTAAAQSSVTAAQLADAFNKEILRIAVQSGTDLQLYMSAQGKLTSSASDDRVSIHSNTGSIETCVTLDPASTGNALVTTLFGASPVGPTCVYDDKIAGENAGDRFGHAIVAADFNGDGFDDIAVGAPKYDNGGNTDAGRTYALYVATPATTPDFAAGAAAADVIVTGSNADDDLGWSLAVGNFDDLGNLDLAIGAPGFTVGGNADAGKVYMILNSAFAANLDADSQASASATSVQNTTAYKPGERYGHALEAAQFDAATPTDEVIVGAPGVETLEGSANRITPADPTTANPGTVYYYSTSTSGFQFDSRGRGSTADSKFGWSIGAALSIFSDLCAGSFNTQCVAIGAPHDEATGFLTDNHGAVYIDLYGSFAPRNPIYGSAAGVELGTGIASANLNSDTITDLLIGRRSSPVTNFVAPAYGGIAIVKGSATTPSSVTAARSFAAIDVNRTSGVLEQSAFGWRVLPIDTDGDGIHDTLIVGAPGGAKKVGTGDVSGRVHIMSQQTFSVP